MNLGGLRMEDSNTISINYKQNPERRVEHQRINQRAKNQMNFFIFWGCGKIGWVKIGCCKSVDVGVLAGIRGEKNGKEEGHNGRERVERYRRGCEIFFGLFINMFGCWRRRTGGLCKLSVGLFVGCW